MLNLLFNDSGYFLMLRIQIISIKKNSQMNKVVVKSSETDWLIQMWIIKQIFALLNKIKITKFWRYGLSSFEYLAQK